MVLQNLVLITLAMECGLLLAIIYLSEILKQALSAPVLLRLVANTADRLSTRRLLAAFSLQQKISAHASRFSRDHVQNPSQRSGGRMGRILRVLVAEDLPANRVLLLKILRKQGYVVAVARDGKEAVELAQRGRFDLVLMDVQMPKMDGVEAAKAIRKRTGDSHIPIVAITALTTLADRQRCLAAGMDGYLAKPVEPQRLLELIDSVTTVPRKTMSSDPKGGKAMPPTTSLPGGSTIGADPAVYDLEATLRRLGGDTNLLGDLVALYDEDSPALIQRLADGIKAADGNVVRHSAHSLRGLAANFGAAALSRPLLGLEEAGNSGRLEEAPILLETVRLESAKLQESLSPYRR
jgi:two-component system, sensor histidine kinase and response regulator